MPKSFKGKKMVKKIKKVEVPKQIFRVVSEEEYHRILIKKVE